MMKFNVKFPLRVFQQCIGDPEDTGTDIMDADGVHLFHSDEFSATVYSLAEFIVNAANAANWKARES